MILHISSPKVILYLKVFIVDLLYVSVGCALTWPSPLVGRLGYTPAQSSWIGSLLALGATIGPASISTLMSRLPRKLVLLGSGCAFLLSWAILAISSSFPVVCVGRIIGGAAMGISFICIPVYLTEISDVAERQAVTTFVDFFLGLGYLVIYYGGPLLGYRVVQGVCAALTICFITGFSMLPESPVYLASRGESKKALDVLTGLRKSKIVAQEELLEIEKYVNKKNDGPEEGDLSILELLKLPGHTKALVLSLIVMVLQQTSGVTVFISFLEPLLEKLTLPVTPSMAGVIFGASNLPCILISPPMARFLGTKLSLVITSIIMAVSMIVFTIYNALDTGGYDVSQYSFVPILALAVYNLFFCSGVGPLSWTIVAEICPAKLKGFICFISTSACWLTAFIVLQSFEAACSALGTTVVYGMFSLSLILGTIFFQVALPDTKGLSLQDIQDKMSGKTEPVNA